MQRRQPPDLDIDRVQPQNVMWQRRLALDSELRAHDSRHHKHANRIFSQRLSGRAPRQLPEIPVLALTEIRRQLALVFSTDEQSLHVSVTPRELVVRSYVIRQGMVLAQAADLIPRSMGAQWPALPPSRHPITG